MFFLQSDSSGDWRTMNSGQAVFDNLDRAIRSLKKNANLARMIWNLRVIDENGKVCCRYVVENDMRLPGCRWRAIQKRAYLLWEANGSPVDDGKKWWHQAESEIDADQIGIEICQ